MIKLLPLDNKNHHFVRDPNTGDQPDNQGIRLQRDFFKRPTLAVAKDLLGKTLVFNNFEGIILETEAYIGQDDPACHATRGMTPRTKIMFGPPGYSYVYLIYGMYYCLNIITELEGFPAGVLLRSLYVKGIVPQDPILLNGPGKLCKQLGINKTHNGIDVIESSFFYIKDEGIKIPNSIKQTPRIGIRVGCDKLWRFVVDNPFNILKSSE